MIDHNKTVGFVLTLLTVGHSSLACFISFIIFILSMYHLCIHRINRNDQIIILHCANMYFFILIYTSMVTIFHTQTILGDLYGRSFQSQSCILSGYFLLVISSSIYMASVTQAFYRLCRIVYQPYRLLLHFWFYAILPFVQVIVASILLCPLFLWQVVIYLPDEYYCYVPFTDFRGILWSVFNIYGIPIVCLLIIYCRIIIFIRKERSNQPMLVRRRQERDMFAIQRVLITVGLLTFAGAPTTGFLIRLIITDDIHPLTFRVAWLAASFSMAGMSVALVFSVPQLKCIVLKHRTQTRAYPLNDVIYNTVEMTDNINNQWTHTFQ